MNLYDHKSTQHIPIKCRHLRSAIGAAAAVLSLVSLSSCQTCASADDEALIRKLIDDTAKRAEAKKVGEVMSVTTDGFVANPGNRDRQGAKQVLFAAFYHYGTFDIKYPRPMVTVDPSAISAEARVPFLIVKQGREIPDLSELYNDPTQWMDRMSELADVYELELKLLKQDGEWFVDKATMHGLKPSGLF